MDPITVEVDEKGNIGKLPEPLQKFFDTRINDAVRRKAEQLEAEFKGKTVDPSERERIKAVEDENSRLKEAEARAQKNYEEADRLKEERHKKSLEERDGVVTAKDQEIARRDTRLRSMLGSEIKASAVAAGAREESLPELVKLLGADLDLDAATLEPFVKGTDGKPLVDKDNKPVSVEGFVKQYLADHPHHIAKPGGRSGRATGGATMRGASAVPGSKEEALAAAADNPNARNVTTAIGAIRKKAS